MRLNKYLFSWLIEINIKCYLSLKTQKIIIFIDSNQTVSIVILLFEKYISINKKICFSIKYITVDHIYMCISFLNKYFSSSIHSRIYIHTYKQMIYLSKKNTLINFKISVVYKIKEKISPWKGQEIVILVKKCRFWFTF